MSVQPQHTSPASSPAAQGLASTLRSSAVLAAAGAWERSSIVSVADSRRITLLITATTDASSGTGSFCEIVPMAAYTMAEPAAGDATWFPFYDTDGISSSADLAAGTLPTGTDYTVAPNWIKRTVQPLAFLTQTTENDTDIIQLSITIDVTAARWFQLMIHEAGDTSNPATVAISYVLSC